MHDNEFTYGLWMFMVYITVVNGFYKPIYNWVGITFFPPCGCSSIYMWIHSTMAYHIIAQFRRMEYPQLDEWIINHLFPTWASHAAGAQFGTRIQSWLGSVSAGGVFQPLWICGNLCVCVFYRQAIADSKRERAAASSAASSSAAKTAEPKKQKKQRRWETQWLQVGIPMRAASELNQYNAAVANLSTAKQFSKYTAAMGSRLFAWMEVQKDLSLKANKMAPGAGEPIKQTTEFRPICTHPQA